MSQDIEVPTEDSPDGDILSLTAPQLRLISEDAAACLEAVSISDTSELFKSLPPSIQKGITEYVHAGWIRFATILLAASGVATGSPQVLVNFDKTKLYAGNLVVLTHTSVNLRAILAMQSGSISTFKNGMISYPLPRLEDALFEISQVERIFKLIYLNTEMVLGIDIHKVNEDPTDTDAAAAVTAFSTFVHVFHEIIERLKNQLSAVLVTRTSKLSEDVKDSNVDGFLSALLASVSVGDRPVTNFEKFSNEDDSSNSRAQRVFPVYPMGETYPTGIDTSSIPLSTNYVRTLYSGMISVPASRFPPSSVLEVVPGLDMWKIAMASYENYLSPTYTGNILHPVMHAIRDGVLTEVVDHSPYFVGLLSDNSPAGAKYLNMLSEFLQGEGWYVKVRALELRNGKLSEEDSQGLAAYLDIRAASNRGEPLMGSIQSELYKLGAHRFSETALLKHSEGVPVFEYSEHEAALIAEVCAVVSPSLWTSTLATLYLDKEMVFSTEPGPEDVSIKILQFIAYPPISEIRTSDVFTILPGTSDIDNTIIADDRVPYPMSSRAARMGTFCRSIHLEVDKSKFKDNNHIAKSLLKNLGGINVGEPPSEVPNHSVFVSDLLSNMNNYTWRKLCQVIQKHPMKASKVLKTLHRLNPSRAVLMSYSLK